jgi:PAS domain S-box-containing protein
VQDVEMGVPASDGTLRWRLVNAQPVRDDHGSLLGAVASFFDITDRKRLEQELRRSRDELELKVQERTAELKRHAELIELSHDAIFVRDLDSRIVFWSKGAEEVYGWNKEEALGKVPHELLETQFPVSLADLNAELLAKGRWEGELVQTCKKGQKLDILSRWSLQRDKDGKSSAILEINIDVTGRKRMEEQFRQVQRMEALGTLAGGIAHDFNNLLNPILLNTELALLDLESHVLPSAESLRLARESAIRGKELVKQIIVFSRHKGQALTPIEISSVINEALKLLKSTALKAVEIRTQMEAGNIVLADPVQMHQVMTNLCMNAVHAMRGKDGVLEVTLAKVETCQDEAAAQLMGVRPGAYVQLTVKDNGQGMSREVLDRAFDPFFTTKQKGEGSGMGLAVVHGIVKKHEGAIRLESEEGRGTAVNIFLPVFQGEAIESASSAPGEIPRGKERILFVDDEESQVRSVEPVLQRLGYRVTVEMDPRKALDRFRSQPEAFDLVITDQVMPYLPGNRLAQELLVIRPDIPIILCTGFSDLVDEGKAKAIGIRDFILKPFRLMEISGMIRKVLDENRAR